jgi:hypothetical protein
MKSFLTLAAAVALSGCSTMADRPARDPFFAKLSTLCGKAFAGRITSPPAAADASFAGKPLIMHVSECSADTIRVPFHVGDDRSRTWVITRTGAGLRLKHDHRHEDGSEDRLTQYGGDSGALILNVAGLLRHEFPADEFSKQLFVQEKIPQSTTNVWAIEFTTSRTFAYELRRPGRIFRVDFDLTTPVPTPPPAWGRR